MLTYTYFYHIDIPTSHYSDSSLDVEIIIALGVSCAVVILVIVISIIIYCKKKPRKQEVTDNLPHAHEYENPYAICQPPDTSRVYTNPEHDKTTSNNNPTTDQSGPNSAYPQTSTDTTTAPDVIYSTQASTTSNVRTGRNASVTVPPIEEPNDVEHYTTEVSEEEDGAILQPSSDEFLTDDRTLAAEVSSSSQGVDGVDPNGNEEDGTSLSIK